MTHVAQSLLYGVWSTDLLAWCVYLPLGLATYDVLVWVARRLMRCARASQYARPRARESAEVGRGGAGGSTSPAVVEA
jgi:hypothetical protein